MTWSNVLGWMPPVLVFIGTLATIYWTRKTGSESAYTSLMGEMRGWIDQQNRRIDKLEGRVEKLNEELVFANGRYVVALDHIVEQELQIVGLGGSPVLAPAELVDDLRLRRRRRR